MGGLSSREGGDTSKSHRLEHTLYLSGNFSVLPKNEEVKDTKEETWEEPDCKKKKSN